MSKNFTREKPPMPTIWRVPDELWEKIEPILALHDPPKPTGRPRVDQRASLDAIIFRMRSGCQWNHTFPRTTSFPRRFQRASRTLQRDGSRRACWI